MEFYLIVWEQEGKESTESTHAFSFKCRQFLPLTLGWREGEHRFTHTGLLFLLVCFLEPIYPKWNISCDFFFILKNAREILNGGPPLGKPPGNWKDMSMWAWKLPKVIWWQLTAQEVNHCLCQFLFYQQRKNFKKVTHKEKSINNLSSISGTLVSSFLHLSHPYY